MKNKTSIYPRGATNANWFTAFNAVSFQIVLGAPMFLYAKSIGATATALGIIAALTPLLTICQIPAALHLERIGYKRFIFYGWGLRTFCIFAIALIPLMGFLGNAAKLWCIVLALFLFNLLRGISSGAWLPWLTELLPEPVRGRFLSRDQFFLHCGSLVALLACARLLSEKSHSWQFSLVFFLSAAGGWISLLFLKIIPDIEPGEALKKSNLRVPWREIVTYPPFLKLTVYVLLFVFSVGSAGVFGIAFLKSKILYGQSRILYITTLYFAGAILSLPLVGRIINRTSSKAMLFASMGAFSFIFLGWTLLAAGVVTPSLALIGALYFVSGIAGANFAVAQTRLMMDMMPQMGRSHFFAFYSVITSLGLGVAPVVWGRMIDLLNHFTAVTGPVHWNNFSIYYFLTFVLVVGNTLYTAALEEKAEPRPEPGLRDLIFATRLKRLSRFWQR